MPYTDNFNRTDGALGSNWITPATTNTGANGVIQIVGNQAAAVTDDKHSFAIYSAGSFIDNQYSQIKIVTTNAAWTGVAVRVQQNVDRFYLAFFFGPNPDCRIYRWWDGTFTQLAQTLSQSYAVNDILRLVVAGDATSITCWMYKNNSIILRWISPDPTWIKTGGNAGIGLYSPAGQNLRDEDWQGGNAAITSYSDNFNRADGALGANWGVTPANQASFAIASNVVTGPTSAKQYYAFYSGASFNDNQFAQVKLGVLGTWSGVILRADASLNRFYLGLYDNSGAGIARIYVMWDGSLTQLAQTATGLWAANDVMKMDVFGTISPIQINIYRNGTVMATWNSPDNSFVRTGGSPGIAMSTTTGAMTLDDWVGGNSEPTLDPSGGETRLYQLNGADPFRKSWIDQATAVADQFYWV